MKYCAKCGKELFEEAYLCPGCGCLVDNTPAPADQTEGFSLANPSTKTAVKVLLILATVIQGLYILPLFWCIPMTINACRKLKRNRRMSVGFKICVMIFLSGIAGVVLLCAKDPVPEIIPEMPKEEPVPATQEEAPKE